MRAAFLLPPLLACSALLAAPLQTPGIDEAVQIAIEDHRIPGGVVWVEQKGHSYHRAYGTAREDTIFDVASLTKVTATTPAIWILIERGKVNLDEKVTRYIKEFPEYGITIRHLLTHTSGLRPDLDLDEPWEGYDTAMRLVMQERPRNTPGETFRYSDINFELLGEVVRRVSGEPLDVFAQKEIFKKLGMRDTGFRPRNIERVAPTENGLQGVVHDPTARRMGGVAGHAGLFTTAADLAKYARMLLRGGGPILKPETVRLMTGVMSPQNVAARRAGGFDVDSSFSRPRGDLFPIGSFGHTGFTGVWYWIDPASDSFYIFLSNRGKGSVLALQKELGTLAARAVGYKTTVKRRIDWVTGGADVQNGIDVLHAGGYKQLQGLRVGLITNHTGIDRAWNPTVDLLRSAPGVRLVALFSPEHGIRGAADQKVKDDQVSGLPVYSLYGEHRAPTNEQLANLDALVFDIQDIGTRFYTYIATMGLAMEAAAKAHKKFIVLDRVNPIGGSSVEGPLAEGEQAFTSYHPLPIRHGMTVGELARMFREERRIDVDLEVVPLRGWKRDMWQDEAGLPWIDTSPNMRSLNAAALYPGIGLLESVISVGRGTATPFEILGAPYIDGNRLAAEVHVEGLRLEPARFTPMASIFKGEECGGVRLIITDRKALQPVRAGLAIAAALKRMYGERFAMEKMAPLLRNDRALKGGSFEKDEQEFRERRAKFLLY
ncbi:MAG TPA: exo-beta-N-acetylmuramidase NamZ domain-containing protein [Thermoanaerobaculia bacterium]|nr:exo-beta-N-acetylmuramidase NamZ domain-containing protein [Thermoanaerobaculia bacterium]